MKKGRGEICPAGNGVASGNIQDHIVLVLISATLYILSLIVPVLGSDFLMKGPGIYERRTDRIDDIETSSVRVALLGLIKLYQWRVSPTGGPDRCGFHPSCSNYGYAAIKEEGPILGLMLIGDRLTRCNIFKKPGPDYALLPSGKLFDPISSNLLFEK
jgi:putative membrane protein insertion efficiency factor